MILWFAAVQIAIALAAGVVAVAVLAAKQPPNDYALGATLLVGVLLLVQIVVAVVAPLTGNVPLGDPLEFWMYLIVAAVLPFGAGFWALVDRRRSANLVLLVVHFAVAVMLYRMLVIWG